MNLENKTVKELREIAKECGIKGRWNMTKDQLISEINARTYDPEEQNAESSPVVENRTRIDENAGKVRYLKNIEEGVLVAYNSPEGIMKSAKVIRISQKNEKLKIVDYFGNISVIDFAQVVWVKTGKRWPKNIYYLIKRGTWAENTRRNL